MGIFRSAGTVILALAALAAAGCSKEVKVGAVISESGAVAPYGRQVARGLDLALEEINAAGGFKGQPIQLIYRDDKTNPEAGEQAILELIEQEGIDLVIGAVSSPVTMSIAPICEQKKVLLLSPSSSAPGISDMGEYVFRNYPSDILEGTAMADFAKRLGVRRVVIFALDNAFGDGLTQVFTRRFESKSRKVLKTFRVSGDDMGALGAMVEEVKEIDPEGIYVVTYVDVLAEILKQFDAAGLDVLTMGSASVTEQLTELAGEAADLLVYPQPSFDPESTEESVAAFVKAFREKYRQEPDIYAAHGYDALKLIWQSMQNTGFAYPDEVRRGLMNLKDFQGAAGRTSFDERGDVVRYPTVFVLRDGQSIPYDKFEAEGGQLPGIDLR